jgi:curved DNA-binding protein CbpA
MVKRDPRDVLGVRPDSTAAQIKAAWRRLARAHHPDLTGDDPAASRVATRQMAEINDAYAALTRDDRRRSTEDDSAEGTAPGFEGGPTIRRGGPPTPKPTRPVTARVDTSSTFRPHNNVANARPKEHILSGQPPLRGALVEPEPLRASTPTGPATRGRLQHFRRPAPPTVEGALEHPIEFGKFHGHTLGQIAGFEPSYIDWLAGTVTRDPDLVSAARVVQAELDRRGIRRRSRPIVERPGRSA